MSHNAPFTFEPQPSDVEVIEAMNRAYNEWARKWPATRALSVEATPIEPTPILDLTFDVWIEVGRSWHTQHFASRKNGRGSRERVWWYQDPYHPLGWTWDRLFRWH